MFIYEHNYYTHKGKPHLLMSNEEYISEKEAFKILGVH